jgi:hypothetical protein
MNRPFKNQTAGIPANRFRFLSHEDHVHDSDELSEILTVDEKIEKKPMERIAEECDGSCCDCQNDDDVNCLLVNTGKR